MKERCLYISSICPLLQLVQVFKWTVSKYSSNTVKTRTLPHPSVSREKKRTENVTIKAQARRI